MAKSVDTQLAIRTALLAGELLIENGSNMDRVNDTMDRIAATAGLTSFQGFTTLTGVVASAEGLPNAQVVSIHNRANDLNKIALVNGLSRKFSGGHLTLKQLYHRLRAVQKLTDMTSVGWQLLAAAVLSAVLMIVFTGDYLDAPVDFVIGGVSYGVFLLLNHVFRIKYLGEFAASLVIGLLAFLAVTLHWASNIDTLIVGGVMPLVPGIPLTNAMRDLVSGNLISGPTRAIEAVLTAAAIGCAIVIVLRYV
ncbi:threonine/serine exporter family protein [uncultured Limosilactobacillus sp.]|uniref:threonine/serine exporter family protein n=1 Tax=uncultured Limosilactobacillus sp. TaxID=2837629 RepID=UPI0025EB12EA|nr:threonine/serine exporter family protein [uncultured Limosilactobacillus sp.]